MLINMDAVILLSALLPVISPLESCPTFGSGTSQGRTAVQSDQRSGLLINFGDPAQCNGTVTAWSYCFHRPQEQSDDLFSAKFIVFRRDLNNRNIYNRVEGSVTTVVFSYQNSSGPFCRVKALARDEEFRVEQNDLIGACLYRNDYEPLELASQDNSNNRLVYYSENSIYDSCSENGFNTIDITSNFNDRDWILHLSVQITSDLGDCGIGNKLSPTTPHNLPAGTYLDTQHPSNCSGNITEWHMCYYTSAIQSNSQYRLDIGIWRRNSSTNEYSLLEESFRNLTWRIRHGNRVPIIKCITEQVEPVSISSNDIVGIVWNQNSALYLPIVAATNDNSRLFALSLNDRIPSVALHLYASVQGADEPSTNTVGFPGGSIAAIVVVVMVVFIGIVVAVVLIGVLYWRRWGYKVIVKSESSVSSRLGTSNALGKKEGVSDNKPPIPVGVVKSIPVKSVPVKPIKPRPLRTTTAMLDRPHDAMEVGGYDISVDYRSKRSNSKQPTARNEREESTEAVYAELLEKNMQQDIYSGIDHYKDPASNKVALYAQLKACGVTTIKRKFIQMLSHLGSGQFGNVELGTWDNGSKKVSVALKMLNKGSSVQDTVKFLQEAAIMAQFHHPNVIKLYGVMSSGEPIVLVVELADCDLLNHLEQMESRLSGGEVKGQFVTDLLLKFSQQVGLGMQYLCAKGFVHRDLASRNILVKNNKICKIADFGMSRDLAQEEVYISSGGKIPLKWTAPEAVHFRKYSTASDVWSYGCVLYEIWSLGHKPFGEERNLEVVKLVKSGFRLPPPPGCPRVVYDTMIRTWHPDPESRPVFRDLVLTLVGNRKQVLEIPHRDLDSHPNAGTLGVELEAGLHMYKDLQDAYRLR